MKNRDRGIIFMPDISGFTRFVKETDMLAGQKVVSKLLSSIIEHNEMQFKIAEIEGDAILFYHFGKPFAVKKILNQFDKMLRAFEQVVEDVSKDFPQAKTLSLKLVVHYGELTRYDLMGFQKLYGSTVIEAHRLLKNDIAQPCYVLLTDAYTQAVFKTNKSSSPSWDNKKELCQIYDELGSICFSYLPFDFPAIKRRRKSFDKIADSISNSPSPVFTYTA
ncbi:uncharacterized protein DUF2652 [Flavobacterium araucananum]|uniref:DUF2652 domain-containing protein n=1 Tax=Flavobacterium araucananum TaxID=946678 RepID=A0A227NI72_9FLAO|nr:DUF2652 domain-containing protein [Flavobacterium araucananum]OXE96558.1 hypothetical protein B0A64_23770 [Flavobacterium araucananum]PWJ97073.1 uncharacterized protein DUF2652 [Flavobacterium araucananum]